MIPELELLFDDLGCVPDSPYVMSLKADAVNGTAYYIINTVVGEIHVSKKVFYYIIKAFNIYIHSFPLYVDEEYSDEIMSTELLKGHIQKVIRSYYIDEILAGLNSEVQ